MKKLELICTYSDWKKKSESEVFKSLSQEVARGLELTLKSCLHNEDMSVSEKEELESFEKSSANDTLNTRYTELCHKITDKCINPVEAEIDFEEIGRLQFAVERMKYPCVLPNDEI